MKLTRWIGTLAALLITSAKGQTPPGPVVLNSPDGQLAITFQTVADNAAAPHGGSLVYSVQFRGKPVLEPSKLALVLEGQDVLGYNVRILDASPSTLDETYGLVTGKSTPVRNHCNAVALDLQEDSGLKRRFRIEARAFDDAVAFRYVVPEQEALKEFRLAAEHTFRLPGDATAYALILPKLSLHVRERVCQASFKRLCQPGRRSQSRANRLPTAS